MDLQQEIYNRVVETTGAQLLQGDIIYIIDIVAGQKQKIVETAMEMRLIQKQYFQSAALDRVENKIHGRYSMTKSKATAALLKKSKALEMQLDELLAIS